MYSTCPDGVSLAKFTAKVAVVESGCDTRWSEFETLRYWSSLLPPRLMTLEASVSAVISPDTPMERHTASVAGLADHNIRCLPSAAAESASARAWRSSG